VLDRSSTEHMSVFVCKKVSFELMNMSRGVIVMVVSFPLYYRASTPGVAEKCVPNVFIVVCPYLLVAKLQRLQLFNTAATCHTVRVVGLLYSSKVARTALRD
jgi:hypothetical protein